jgi:ABC-type transport system involved in cytochrome c biogenesis ATPase subunit
MSRYGYFLSSEEYEPASLIEQARMAGEAGFDALWISDHYHPWLEPDYRRRLWPVLAAALAPGGLLVFTGHDERDTASHRPSIYDRPGS